MNNFFYRFVIFDIKNSSDIGQYQETNWFVHWNDWTIHFSTTFCLLSHLFVEFGTTPCHWGFDSFLQSRYEMLILFLLIERSFLKTYENIKSGGVMSSIFTFLCDGDLSLR